MTDQPLPAAEPTPLAPVQSKPRRRTLFVLVAAFTVWVAILIAMYFTTVYPQRHPKDGRPAIIVPPR